jgi:hypothetical protein
MMMSNVINYDKLKFRFIRITLLALKSMNFNVCNVKSAEIAFPTLKFINLTSETLFLHI